MEVAAITSIESLTAEPEVLRLDDFWHAEVAELLATYGLQLQLVKPGRDIPGSYWGDTEAGLVGQQLLARLDTPVHSILHEACHYICMDPLRRSDLHTNAGGGYDEENAVCYLQILLADRLNGMGRERMFTDMDAWAYTFRMGSARAWFENDASEDWGQLLEWGIIDTDGQPTGRLRSNR